MMIKAESYKIFSEIYCPIVPAPLELFSGDGCRSDLAKISISNCHQFSGPTKIDHPHF